MAALATARQAGADAGAAAVRDIAQWLGETRLRQQELVDECVRRVLRILKARQER